MSIFNPNQNNNTTSSTNQFSIIVDSEGNPIGSQYLEKSGGILNGTLLLEGNETEIIYPDGTTQSNFRVNQLDNVNLICNNMHIEVIQKIKSLREHKNISLQEMADLLHLDVISYNILEHKKSTKKVFFENFEISEMLDY